MVFASAALPVAGLAEAGVGLKGGDAGTVFLLELGEAGVVAGREGESALRASVCGGDVARGMYVACAGMEREREREVDKGETHCAFLATFFSFAFLIWS